MNTFKTLEFDIILQMLSDNALSEGVRTRCLGLRPSLDEAEALRRLGETTQARLILASCGAPPLQPVENLLKVLALIEADAMLLPEQIEHVSTFLTSCRRLKQYLKKAETTGADIAAFGGSIDTLPELEEEIGRRIISGAVDDRASPALSGIRRKMTQTSDEIRRKLDTLLRRNAGWFSESFVSQRNGRYTLPVRREFKNNVPGTLVDMSHTGSTCFIEPDAVRKLKDELDRKSTRLNSSHT
jgi:DNA mismatch repair protein MutS2